jgi:auxin-responsive protein IAA
VKVKKEGDAIGRKVDLSLHASYDDLLATLRRMFPTTAATNQGMYVAKLFRGSSIIIRVVYTVSSDQPYSAFLIHRHTIYIYTRCCADDKEISSSTSCHVVVTYEDGEGDWMLVGDVPWE